MEQKEKVNLENALLVLFIILLFYFFLFSHYVIKLRTFVVSWKENIILKL